MSEHDEKCQRCSEAGEDRRTLWMACFYDMSELAVPFDMVALQGQYRKLERFKEKRFGKLPVFAEGDGRDDTRPFYTLRVCKECRAEWMDAISRWFSSMPAKAESPGTGIFVRENGVNAELTEEQWRERNSGREPVRV